VAAIALLATTSPALACAGLIGSNGAVNLGRTTTLAAYHDGVEHYVTAFKFLGGGGQFGTLIPLPEVLDFYAQRSPVFLAAVFDGDAALQRGQQIGDGTPVHLTIPVDNPWVPLRILGLGKQPTDAVDADVFLLTDIQPALLPAPKPGLLLEHSAPATSQLLDDLRADAGMDWVPRTAWLTELSVSSTVAEVKYDLAIDASGQARPSFVAAGLEPPAPPPPDAPAPIAAVLALSAPALLFAAYRLA
jgi:hypothetical protein